MPRDTPSRLSRMLDHIVDRHPEFRLFADTGQRCVQRLEQLEVLPARLGYPGEGDGLADFIQRRVSLHVEIELAPVDVRSGTLPFSGIPTPP